jgi:hypothetical protein
LPAHPPRVHAKRATDPVYVALKNKKWEDVKPILAEPDYVLPYAFLTSLCRIGTCAVERGFINTLIGVGEPHVSRSYGPFDFTLLHIALIFGNEYQLKTYFNGLTYKQWSSLCERKDSRGMKPIDLAAHIIDSIKTDNLHRVKRYFPSEVRTLGEPSLPRANDSTERTILARV